jgi:U3 small nucleolar RNA-associated protein 11
MMSSRTHRGGQKLADRGNKALSQEAVKLLKTQDAGYLRTMAQKTRKERERLEKNYLLREGKGVHVLGQNAEDVAGEHMIFVESTEEQQNFDPQEWFKTSEKGLGRAYNLPRTTEVDESMGGGGEDRGQASVAEVGKLKSRRVIEAELQARKDEKALRRLHQRAEDARRHRLEAARARERDLVAAGRELDLQRAKMSNSVGGVNRNGVKWKAKERKR